MQAEKINPNTGKPVYYKDNPETKRKENAKQMYVNGKYISKSHPLHKPGKYKSFGDAAYRPFDVCQPHCTIGRADADPVGWGEHQPHYLCVDVSGGRYASRYRRL